MKYNMDNHTKFCNEMGDDCWKWAEAFCERFGTDEIYEDLMADWFAFAMETALSIRMKKIQAFLDKIDCF